MDVNKDNFGEHVEIMKEAIRKADFIAFDCEFTGWLPPRSIPSWP